MLLLQQPSGVVVEHAPAPVLLLRIHHLDNEQREPAQGEVRRVRLDPARDLSPIGVPGVQSDDELAEPSCDSR